MKLLTLLATGTLLGTSLIGCSAQEKRSPQIYYKAQVSIEKDSGKVLQNLKKQYNARATMAMQTDKMALKQYRRGKEKFAEYKTLPQTTMGQKIDLLIQARKCYTKAANFYAQELAHLSFLTTIGNPQKFQEAFTQKRTQEQISCNTNNPNAKSNAAFLQQEGKVKKKLITCNENIAQTYLHEGNIYVKHNKKVRAHRAYQLGIPFATKHKTEYLLQEGLRKTSKNDP